MKCSWHLCLKEERQKSKFCSQNCKVKFYVNRKRKQLKLDAISYKGGKCKHCGYNKCVSAMSFHHLDPTQKDFAIGAKGHTRSWQKIKEELDKCILLCHNCHAEEHEKLTVVG